MKEKLDLNLVVKLGLEKLDSVDLVRRKDNSYALNKQGKLGAISFSNQKEAELIIAEEAVDLEHLNLANNTALTQLVFNKPLPKLTHLYLNNCAITQLTIPSGFKALKQVYVQKNKLTALVFEGGCPALELLDASENQIERLVMPKGFGNLTYLYLQKNKLEQLPEDFYLLKKLDTLYLAGNPLTSIKDVVGSGDHHNSASDLIAYLDSIKGKKTINLYEAKLILVGNPEVGKSSIRIKLLDRNASLPKEEERTPGLVVKPYLINDLSTEITQLDHPIDFQLNIWDFGGQGRYREIQQLFCSRKALYLYVTSFDDTVEKEEDYIGLEYWLSMVNAYSFDHEENRPSPVIYVLNKIDSGGEWDGKKENASLFENLVKFYKISCKTLQNFDQLTNGIREVLPNVSKDMFSSAYREEWFTVKKCLDDLAAHHLSYSDYLLICTEEGLNEAEAKAWLNILDRIGSVIYFGENSALRDWIVRNPIWVKDAICNVIDSPLMRNDGILKEAYFDSIWKDYPDRLERQNLVKLMMAYKLAFAIKRFGEEMYVVPSALYNKPKPVLDDWPKLQQVPDQRVQLRFEPFIPAGIVNKLMVSLNRHIFNYLMWGNGCILHDADSNTYVELQEDWANRTIQLNLFGENSYRFYHTIVQALLEINTNLKDTKSIPHLVFNEWIWYEGEFLQKKVLEKFSDFAWGKLNQDVLFDAADLYGIENEINGLKQKIDLLIEKKNKFEKDLVLTYDEEKEFGLQNQVKDIETEIGTLREKIRQLSQRRAK